MGLSFIALQRIAVKEIENERYKNRVFLKDGRDLSDKELVDKLETFGITLDKKLLTEWSEKFFSAEEMFYWLKNQKNIAESIENINDEDWIWICLTVLWERWNPGNPSFEMLDDLIQEGYDFLDSDETDKACESWLKAWNGISNFFKKHELCISAFDERFKGTYPIEDWLYDFEMELGNMGRVNPKFLSYKIEVLKDFFVLFPNENKDFVRTFKRAYAECLYAVGKLDDAEDLFENYLEEDPKWGWGWIGYSDLYWLNSIDEPDYERAESILKGALSIENVEEKEEIKTRFIELYGEMGKPMEIAEMWIKDNTFSEPPALGTIDLKKSPEHKSKKKI